MGQALRPQVGGRTGLRALLGEHWGELEADFRRFYGLRLSEAVYGKAGTAEGRLPPRELLNLIHQLPPESALHRKLRGSMAPWGLPELLLRRIDLTLQGANWQRSGGKGSKPKAIELPDHKGRGNKPAAVKPSGGDIAARLKNLGLIPAGTSE